MSPALTALSEPEPAAHGSAVTPAAGAPALKGRQKAAVLLVMLGTERAARVFSHLRESEIETLSLEMAQLGSVPGDAVEAIFEEASDGLLAAQYIAQGGVEFAREVLENALGAQRAAAIIERLSAIMEARPFDFLRHVPSEQIQAILASESSQTAALVLANMPTSLGAQVLAQFSVEAQAEVAIRIADMSETSPEVLKDVEQVLRQRLAVVGTQDYALAGGAKGLAELLNSAGRATERNVIDALASANVELADEVRALLFVFEDIVKIDDRGVQLALKEIDQKDLALALRGVPEQVKQKVLGNVSQRGAEMLLEEIEYQPPQRRSVIEEAQGRIVAEIRRLEDAGALTIARGGVQSDAEELL